MASTSNFKQLDDHLTRKYKGMLKSKELDDAGKRASKAMGVAVKRQLEAGGASGYDYNQTSDLHYLISNDAKYGYTKSTPSKLSMGAGDINDLSDSNALSMRDVQVQRHWLGSANKGRYVSVRLKAERQMPKWIIAEFGSGGLKDGAVPGAFKVTYAKRPGKEFLFGPSSGPAGPNGTKPGYFKLGQDRLNKMYGKPNAKGRKHPGVRAGKIYRRGLEDAKPDIKKELAIGIQKYLST